MTAASTPAPFGPPLATVNPTTGETLQRFEPFDAAEVENRLAAAQSAAAAWAATPVGDRSRLLITVAELLEGELPDIAHVLTTEMGKP
ncbi:MAG TPA: aldehyde dehydrogenase family protein, partial [Acidimicrobiales bacterium]|nr:aldehyde dehydrogenase family protein [Acidimicrobiales bacterium]